MKYVLPLVLSLGFATPAMAQAPSPTEALVKERCALCHMQEEDSAPSLGQIKALTAAVILEKMNTGTMQPMSAGLSEQQKKDIADFLGVKPAQ